MHDPHNLLLLDLGVAALVALDLVRTLRTGRARGRFGTITRKARPARFWRYVYSSYVFLAGCAAVFIWILVRPATFQ